MPLTGCRIGIRMAAFHIPLFPEGKSWMAVAPFSFPSFPKGVSTFLQMNKYTSIQRNVSKCIFANVLVINAPRVAFLYVCSK